MFCAEFVKHKYAYQAHLQRICHFLVQGEGVDSTKLQMAVYVFVMAMMTLEFSDVGPHLLHFEGSFRLSTLPPPLPLM